MASNTNNNEKEATCSLVLTIFKGVNFVCKKANGIRCQIEAKCCDQVLLSGVVPVSSTNSEPQFNFQLAWQFTRRQLRELRENKVSVKVRCLSVNVDGDKSTELGYAVLFVKEAFPSSGGDVDPSKARTHSLLGTKDDWKSYHPQLKMQLHVEDYSIEHIVHSPNVQTVQKEDNSRRNQKPVVVKKEIENINSLDKTPRVEVIPQTMSIQEKFQWKINEEDGCFQLGEPSDNDDLYVFNITVVTATNLHLLWNGRSPKKAFGNEYKWQIRYKAYGCEIKSDPFGLSMENNDRRTFIGDKSSARIRAYSPNFCDYLGETAIEFHVVRYELSPSQEGINEEIMGVSFAELNDLACSDINELRATLEIVSEWGYPNTLSSSEKPEIRVVFQLDATPGFFSKMALVDDQEDFRNESYVYEPNDFGKENKLVEDLINETDDEIKDLRKGSLVRNVSSVEELDDFRKVTRVNEVADFRAVINPVNNQVDDFRQEERVYESEDSRKEDTPEDELDNVEREKFTGGKHDYKIRKEKHANERERDELHLWEAEKKEEFQIELKKKERAYLRILAEEAAAIDRQREKIMTDKLADLKKNEKELRRFRTSLEVREKTVQRNEMEFAQLNQQTTLRSTAILENAKLSIRKMQEEHKIEVSSLRRRNEEYEAELKKCKVKLDILQNNLNEKEDYVNRLKTEKFDCPDSRLSEKLKLLEQENKLLRKQIVEFERSRDQYKKQSQALCLKLARLQDERDKQLKDENENLRLQILASKEHKELKKERKAVSDVSQRIRTLQENNEKKSTNEVEIAKGRKSDEKKSNKPRLREAEQKSPEPPQSSNESEIQRLTNMRRGLLNTGAYTKYDMVIKEMERRIIGLAEGQLVK